MKYFHKQGRVSDIKDKRARTELSRAHAMVALLCVSNITLLVLVYSSSGIPTSLSVSAVVLLGLVAVFSACVALSLWRRPRK